MPQYLTEPMALLTAPTLASPMGEWQVVHTAEGQRSVYDPGHLAAHKNSAQEGGIVSVHETYQPSLQVTLLKSDLDSLARLHPTAIKGTHSIAFTNRSGVHEPRCWVLVPAAAVEKDSSGKLTLAPFATVQWYTIQKGIAQAEPVSIKQISSQGELVEGYRVTVREQATVAAHVLGQPYRAGVTTMGMQVPFGGSLLVGVGYSLTRGTTATYIANGALQMASIGELRYQNGHPLLEEQRTNHLTYSNTTNAFVVNTRMTPTTTTGTLDANAVKLTPSTDNNSHVSDTNSVTGIANGERACASFWAKPDGYTWLRVFFDSGYHTTDSVSAYVHLSGAGSVGTTSSCAATIEKYGDWYLVKVVPTNAADEAAPNFRVRFMIAEADGDTSFAGDGTSGIIVDQIQVEEGDTCTSTIPTSGAAATRNQDVLAITYPSLYDDSHGLTVALSLKSLTAALPAGGDLLEVGHTSGNQIRFSTGAEAYLRYDATSIKIGDLDAVAAAGASYLWGCQLGSSLTNDGQVVGASSLTPSSTDLATSNLEGEAWTTSTITLYGLGYELQSLLVMQGLPAHVSLKALLGVA